MKLVLDIDGVIADFTLGITQKMHEMDPSVKVLRSPQQPSWDFREMPPGLFLKAFKEVTSKDPYGFNANLESLLTEVEGKRLSELSWEHEVYFATNRPGGNHALRGTRVFLRSKFGIDDPNVVLTAKKGEFAAAVGATHLIDDKAGNAVYAKYHSPATEVFLLDAPYNRFDQSVVGTKVKRVSTFTEFLDALK